MLKKTSDDRVGVGYNATDYLDAILLKVKFPVGTVLQSVHVL